MGGSSSVVTMVDVTGLSTCGEGWKGLVLKKGGGRDLPHPRNLLPMGGFHPDKVPEYFTTANYSWRVRGVGHICRYFLSLCRSMVTQSDLP